MGEGFALGWNDEQFPPLRPGEKSSEQMLRDFVESTEPQNRSEAPASPSLKGSQC